MKTMKAIVFNEVKNFDSLKLQDFPYPAPGPGEATVAIRAAALNRRDIWIIRGMYPGIVVPIIPGSDGAGVVEEVGQGVDKKWLGKEVIINPGLDWGENPRVQQNRFRILGMPDHGAQAEYVKAPAANLFPKPAHLSFPQAAAIPLGGVTGYRALFTQGQLDSGHTVLLTGIGGGVAALMLKMALAVKARVLVTSGDPAKIEAALKIGAGGGANYREADWDKQILSQAGEAGVDLIVDSAGGEGFDKLISIVKPGGRVVFFGATAGNPSTLNLRKIFWKQITVQGATMGSPTDFAQMVRLFDEYKIEPIIDGPYPFEEYRQVYQRMIDGKQFGKLVMEW